MPRKEFKSVFEEFTSIVTQQSYLKYLYNICVIYQMNRLILFFVSLFKVKEVKLGQSSIFYCNCLSMLLSLIVCILISIQNCLLLKLRIICIVDMRL